MIAFMTLHLKLIEAFPMSTFQQPRADDAYFVCKIYTLQDLNI